MEANKKVKRPKGAKPITPNQTKAEQKHNSLINKNMEDINMENINTKLNLNDYMENQVEENYDDLEEEDFDCSSDCVDDFEDKQPETNAVENNNDNKNNKEENSMEKMYTNKIEGTIETVSSLYNELFITIINNQIQAQNLEFRNTEEQQAYIIETARLAMIKDANKAIIYFNIDKIHPFYHTPLAVAIRTRMKNENYDKFECFANINGAFVPAVDKNNKPSTGLKPVQPKTIFRKPVWNHNLQRFIDRYAITKDIVTYIVFPFETSVVEGKSEVIIFNLVPERKTKLENELKTASTARKITGVATNILDNTNTTVSVLAEETVPVVMDAMGKLTVNTAGAVVEGARAFTTSVARETLNYIYTHRDAQSLFGQDTINAWNRVKNVWEEKKAKKNGNEEECY